MTLAATKIAGFRRIRCLWWHGKPPKVGDYFQAQGPRVQNAYLIRELDLDENGVGKMTVQAVAICRLRKDDTVHPWEWKKRRRARALR